MTKSLIAICMLMITGTVVAQNVYHEGYWRKDGTYVQPHYQTAPDQTRMNNYSTQGNTNPYTGQAGTVNPYQQPQPVYQQPQPVYQQQYGQPQQRTCNRDYFGKVTCY